MADPRYVRERAAAARRTASEASDPVDAEDLLNLALIYEQAADRFEQHRAIEQRRREARRERLTIWTNALFTGARLFLRRARPRAAPCG